MVTSQITTKDSARLSLGELIALADRLRHSAELSRQEGRDSLEEVFEQLHEFAAGTRLKSGGQATSAHPHVSRIQHELETAWLEVDHAVDELISQAADEIYRFTTIAESRIHECESRVRHDRARAELLTKDRSER